MVVVQPLMGAFIEGLTYGCGQDFDKAFEKSILEASLCGWFWSRSWPVQKSSFMVVVKTLRRHFQKLIDMDALQM